jgi:hypothetical protein
MYTSMIRVQNIFISLVFFITIGISGCNNNKEKLESSIDIFKSYKDKGVATVFSVPPGLATIFLDTDQPGNAELKEILGDVAHLSFLIIPNNGDIKESIYFTEFNELLNDINFVDLAMINNGSEIVKVMVLTGKDEQIIEMVVLVSNYDNFFTISFKGDIQMNSIANLTKPENMVAVSNLNRFKK